MQVSGSFGALSTFSTRGPFFETFALLRPSEAIYIEDITMEIPAEPITPEFIEEMVDRVVSKLTAKLDQLDISMDYIAAALLDTDAAGIGARQMQRGRFGGGKSHLGQAAPQSKDTK